jgi:hypothetical protein
VEQLQEAVSMTVSDDNIMCHFSTWSSAAAVARSQQTDYWRAYWDGRYNTRLPSHKWMTCHAYW